jgi:hypothetical protein
MVIFICLAVLAVLSVIVYVYRKRKKLKSQNWPSHSGFNEYQKHKKFDRHGRAWCEICKKYVRVCEHMK